MPTLTINDIDSTSHAETLEIEQEHNLTLYGILSQSYADDLYFLYLISSVAGILSQSHVAGMSVAIQIISDNILSTSHISEINLFQLHVLR